MIVSLSLKIYVFNPVIEKIDSKILRLSVLISIIAYQLIKSNALHSTIILGPYLYTKKSSTCDRYPQEAPDENVSLEKCKTICNNHFHCKGIEFLPEGGQKTGKCYKCVGAEPIEKPTPATIQGTFFTKRNRPL